MQWPTFLSPCFLLIVFCIFFSSHLSLADLYQETLLAGDLIAQVNTNVKPSPLKNHDIIKYFPAEQILDPKKDVAVQLFEGCLTLEEKTKEILLGDSSKDEETAKQVKEYIQMKRWPSQTIAYEVKSLGISNLDEGQMRAKVENTLQKVMESVCVNFRPKIENDLNWILFYDGYGCHSGFGKKEHNNLPTLISIGKGCQSDAIITHLLLHALGFLHEQNRPDRDEYVNVQLENIKNDYEVFFKRHQFQSLANESSRYDFKSLMHFSKSAYGRDNDNPTMTAKNNDLLELGAKQLSPIDIKKINKMFECPSGEWQEWQSWSPCSKPCGFGFYQRKRTCATDIKNCIGKSSEMKACRIRKCYKAPYDTSFEDDWGIWKPRSGNKCNWRRGRTRNKIQLTGPQEDHTTGKGRFAQVQYGEACDQGVQATMYTETIRPIPRETCLNFYYFMSGNGAGKLNVMIKDVTTNSPSLLWTTSGDHGKDWQPGAVTVPRQIVSFKLLMIATIDEPGVSDISVDDIFIDPGKCVEGLEGCQDFHLACKNWSAVGECYKNAGWMLHSCCKSCSGIPECVDEDPYCEERARKGECSSKASEMWNNCCSACQNCLDQDHRCKFWARNGECEKNSNWMEENCKDSCHVCVSS